MIIAGRHILGTYHHRARVESACLYAYGMQMPCSTEACLPCHGRRCAVAPSMRQRDSYGGGWKWGNPWCCRPKHGRLSTCAKGHVMLTAGAQDASQLQGRRADATRCEQGRRIGFVHAAVLRFTQCFVTMLVVIRQPASKAKHSVQVGIEYNSISFPAVLDVSVSLRSRSVSNTVQRRFWTWVVH